MRDTVKAALLSALVLPGAGQIYRGRRIKGGLLILAVTLLLACAVVLVVYGVRDYMAFARVTDPSARTELLDGFQSRIVTAWWVGGAFVLVWLYGIVDALLDRRTGKNCGENGDSGRPGE